MATKKSKTVYAKKPARGLKDSDVFFPNKGTGKGAKLTNMLTVPVNTAFYGLIKTARGINALSKMGKKKATKAKKSNHATLSKKPKNVAARAVKNLNRAGLKIKAKKR